MAVKIISLTNSSHPTGELGKDTATKLLIDRFIYQRLGSLEQNKTILEDYNAGRLPKEFQQFLYDLENRLIDPDISAVDIYLGQLGITEEWQYSKDVVNIPPWTNAFESSEVRQLAEIVDSVSINRLIDASGNRIVQFRKV